ncbi:hypothetical protein Taro_039265 [Colocasia esculenta]|uniref:Secreted protein n=1 Tax=Colocasia esculenta TaxID=4460 RepID=A0A843W8W1_COLES|nr:hypothetical protein [Colocasia esculenta]
MRLWSHVVAPVFRELLCLGRCVLRCCFCFVFDSAGSAGVVFGPTMVLGHGRDSLSQEFIAGWLWWRFVRRALAAVLNSNPSGSSDPWVAARPSGSLAGVWEVGSLGPRPGPLAPTKNPNIGTDAHRSGDPKGLTDRSNKICIRDK